MQYEEGQSRKNVQDEHCNPVVLREMTGLMEGLTFTGEGSWDWKKLALKVKLGFE